MNPVDAEANFLARVREATAGIDGAARVDMTDFPGRLPQRTYDEIANSQGWVVTGTDLQDSRFYLLLKRPGTSVAPPTGSGFLTGPSLDELRKHPHARAAADRISHDLGVDPLSDAALNDARDNHVKLRRKTLRYVAAAAFCGFTLLIVLLFTAKQLVSGSGDTPMLVGAIALPLLIGLGVCWIGARKAEKARRAAVGGYAAAYERLVSAVLRTD